MLINASRYCLRHGKSLLRHLTTVPTEGVDVTTQNDGKVVVMSLRNEGRMNCMTENIAVRFKGLIENLENEHPSALCLVLTGHGNSFAAGADLNWLEERSNTPPAENVEIMKNYYNYFTGLTTLSIPTIAAINGPAVGAGFCVSMFCDIRITSADSKLGANFVKLGINPGMGGTFTMPLKVPSQVAWEMLLTGKIMSGKEAKEKGVVLSCMESREQVLPEALSLASSIVSGSPLAIKETTALLRQSLAQPLQEQLSREAEAQGRTFAGNDIRVGLEAIKNKKVPKF